jgi:hypothetical protein
MLKMIIIFLVFGLIGLAATTGATTGAAGAGAGVGVGVAAGAAPSMDIYSP